MDISQRARRPLQNCNDWQDKFLMKPRARAFGARQRGGRRVALGVPARQRMKQIPSGKQCETEGSTPEIEVMAEAGFEPPVHPSKQPSASQI